MHKLLIPYTKFPFGIYLFNIYTIWFTPSEEFSRSHKAVFIGKPNRQTAQKNQTKQVKLKRTVKRGARALAGVKVLPDTLVRLWGRAP